MPDGAPPNVASAILADVEPGILPGGSAPDSPGGSPVLPPRHPSSPKFAQVFEHSSLKIGEQGLTQSHFDALVRYNERHGCTLFSVGHRRLHFGSYVGVLQVGSLTIEILPKADKSNADDPQTKAKWQRALLDMLRQSGLLDVESAPAANLHLRRSPLIDLYLESFVTEVERLAHAGLVKKYRLHEANLNKLKGRILFSQHVRRNLLHRERLYTAHQTYDADNLFNRILKVALGIVERLAVRPAITARASALSLAFESVSDARITADTFARLRLDRNTQRYHAALQLARLIILNYSPDLRGGREHVLAILFDMNRLFERYILVQLRRTQAKHPIPNLTIEGQRSARFWGSKHIRPDIVITVGTGASPERIILDTKWKVPKDDRPSDEDLKQMYAYNLHLGAARSILLYPRADAAQTEIAEPFALGASPLAAHHHTCATHFTGLFEGDTLRKDVGISLLMHLLQPL